MVEKDGKWVEGQGQWVLIDPTDPSKGRKYVPAAGESECDGGERYAEKLERLFNERCAMRGAPGFPPAAVELAKRAQEKAKADRVKRQERMRQFMLEQAMKGGDEDEEDYSSSDDDAPSNEGADPEAVAAAAQAAIASAAREDDGVHRWTMPQWWHFVKSCRWPSAAAPEKPKGMVVLQGMPTPHIDAAKCALPRTLRAHPPLQPGLRVPHPPFLLLLLHPPPWPPHRRGSAKSLKNLLLCACSPLTPLHSHRLIRRRLRSQVPDEGAGRVADHLADRWLPPHVGLRPDGRPEAVPRRGGVATVEAAARVARPHVRPLPRGVRAALAPPGAHARGAVRRAAHHAARRRGQRGALAADVRGVRGDLLPLPGRAAPRVRVLGERRPPLLGEAPRRAPVGPRGREARAERVADGAAAHDPAGARRVHGLALRPAAQAALEPHLRRLRPRLLRDGRAARALRQRAVPRHGRDRAPRRAVPQAAHAQAGAPRGDGARRPPRRAARHVPLAPPPRPACVPTLAVPLLSPPPSTGLQGKPKAPPSAPSLPTNHTHLLRPRPRAHTPPVLGARRSLFPPLDTHCCRRASGAARNVWGGRGAGGRGVGPVCRRERGGGDYERGGGWRGRRGRRWRRPRRACRRRPCRAGCRVAPLVR